MFNLVCSSPVNVTFDSRTRNSSNAFLRPSIKPLLKTISFIDCTPFMFRLVMFFPAWANCSIQSRGYLLKHSYTLYLLSKSCIFSSSCFDWNSFDAISNESFPCLEAIYMVKPNVAMEKKMVLNACKASQSGFIAPSGNMRRNPNTCKTAAAKGMAYPKTSKATRSVFMIVSSSSFLC